MRGLLAVALFTLALNVSAEGFDTCFAKRPGDAPVLPDGAVVSHEEMHEGQLEAERYLLQAEAYMQCNVYNRRQYQALARQVEAFSEHYNEEMIKFQIRSAVAAGK